MVGPFLWGGIWGGFFFFLGGGVFFFWGGFFLGGGGGGGGGGGVLGGFVFGVFFGGFLPILLFQLLAKGRGQEQVEL